jgi:hypothetical protein
MRRRARCSATAVALGSVLALAACAPRERISDVASPLALDFVWSRPKQPVIPIWPDAPQPPAAVIVHWNPKVYSHDDIGQIAGQQCIPFDRKAVAASRISQRHGLSVQRFDCTIIVGSKSGGNRG